MGGFDVTWGFTKANELFVGRLAMLGFAFATLGEIITGKGAIAQLGFETGISPVDADGLILGLIGFFKDGDDKLFKGGFGFTKDNELFVGRMAQLGFAASLIGELYTGDGPLGQLGLETGIPLNEAEPLLLLSIAFTLLAAINPGKGKFVGDE